MYYLLKRIAEFVKNLLIENKSKLTQFLHYFVCMLEDIVIFLLLYIITKTFERLNLPWLRWLRIASSYAAADLTCQEISHDLLLFALIYQ